MPNKRYIAGRQFEYKVKKELEKDGWTIIRSSGSKGLFDLVGVRFLAVDDKINFWKYQLQVGFWQLKQHISSYTAAKIRDKIIYKLTKALFSLGFPENIIYKNFQETRISCFTYIKNDITGEEKYIMVSFGVIYTPPKKKKLEKRKRRIIKVGKTLKGGEKVAEATSG
ncbi:MAG: hypothetical protein ACO2PO_23695 [Candidatus Calescibacterium sp.]